MYRRWSHKICVSLCSGLTDRLHQSRVLPHSHFGARSDFTTTDTSLEQGRLQFFTHYRLPSAHAFYNELQGVDLPRVIGVVIPDVLQQSIDTQEPEMLAICVPAAKRYGQDSPKTQTRAQMTRSIQTVGVQVVTSGQIDGRILGEDSDDCH